MKQTIYPDLSEIYARKEAASRERARRSFGEKIAMMEALRERVAPLRKLREARREAQQRAAARRSRD